MAVIAGVLPVDILNRRLRRRHRRGVRQCGRADQHESRCEGRRRYPSAPTGQNAGFHAGSVVPRHRNFAELAINEQRPLRQSAKRASRKVSLYSGIQTPKKSKPHWLKPGFQVGFSL